MFDIYNDDWPIVERALVAFSSLSYVTPVFLWITPGGYIAQDYADGCLEVTALASDHPPPKHGLWVWEGSFDAFEDIYDSMEAHGVWRQPTDEEWKCIINQQNPWDIYECET